MYSAALTSATIFTFAQKPRQPDLKRGDGDRRYKDDPDRDQHQQLPSCPLGHLARQPYLRFVFRLIAVNGEPRLADHREEPSLGNTCEPLPVVDSISLVLR